MKMPDTGAHPPHEMPPGNGNPAARRTHDTLAEQSYSGTFEGTSLVIVRFACVYVKCLSLRNCAAAYAARAVPGVSDVIDPIGAPEDPTFLVIVDGAGSFFGAVGCTSENVEN